MSLPETAPIRVHQDAARFLEAVNATEAATGFATRLIEKDYFCTVLLQHLAPLDGALVFKGGTCLAKVHAGFYRLSEDLDFVIPMPTDASRSDRSARMAGMKNALAALPRQRAAFRVVQPLTGANRSTQYIAAVGYTSGLSRQEDAITIEVGLREPL